MMVRLDKVCEERCDYGTQKTPSTEQTGGEMTLTGERSGYAETPKRSSSLSPQ